MKIESKQEKKYLYTGFGFPVLLEKVELVKVMGCWSPKIDIKGLAAVVIRALTEKSGKLTGSQVRFIRDYFSMSLRTFAEKVVKQSHSAVQKWEKAGDQPTSMDENTEDMLRLYILNHLSSENKEHQLYQLYSKLANMRLKNIDQQTLEVSQSMSHNLPKAL